MRIVKTDIILLIINLVFEFIHSTHTYILGELHLMFTDVLSSSPLHNLTYFMEQKTAAYS